jgi:hypothetical protein
MISIDKLIASALNAGMLYFNIITFVANKRNLYFDCEFLSLNVNLLFRKNAQRILSSIATAADNRLFRLNTLYP